MILRCNAILLCLGEWFMALMHNCCLLPRGACVVANGLIGEHRLKADNDLILSLDFPEIPCSAKLVPV